jgi:pimeloyl-ACP methyl ester carboxylesterase
MTCDFLGVSIYVEVRGAGPPLLLLHGIGADADTWSPLARRWAAQCLVMAWDAPGYHRSSDPPRPFSPREYGEAAAHVLASAQVPPAIVVGHSFGGLVALECAAAGPERVAGLVLVDASLGHRRLSDAARDEALTRRIQAIEVLGAEEMARRRTPEILSGAAPPALRQEVESVMRRVRAAGYVSAARAIHGGDALPHLAGFRGPLQVIWGAADRITPLATLEQIRAVRPDADVVLVPGAGHLPYLEAPDLVGERVEAFARRVFGSA